MLLVKHKLLNLANSTSLSFIFNSTCICLPAGIFIVTISCKCYPYWSSGIQLLIYCEEDEFTLKIPIFDFLIVIQILNILFMRRLCYLKNIVCLFCIIMLADQANSQMPQRWINQVAITGWTDDTHYQMRIFDSDNHLVLNSIDIKTGKRSVINPPKSDREELNQSLPSGITLSLNDVIGPDKKSAVITKDNDLFFFSVGYKELKRLLTIMLLN
jgi:hypothetical protein